MAPTLLVLASRSPRRARLLREAGYAFEQADPPFDDPPRPAPDADPAVLAGDLAILKAKSLRGRFDRRVVVLAADTIVEAPDGRAMGQPADRDEARVMLATLSGAVHRVVTAVALDDGERMRTLTDTAAVEVGRLSEQMIGLYVNRDQWMGKAGGYNLFDRREAGWPIGVRAGDDPATVVGLPMRLLRPLLAASAIEPGITTAP